MNAYHYGAHDVFHLAATYAFHIAENQPYIDGNKRAGLLSALNFLAENDVFIGQPVASFFDAMIAISARKLDKGGLAEVFRAAAELGQERADPSVR